MAVVSEKSSVMVNLGEKLKGSLNESIGQIESVNSDIYVLSVNAKIQAMKTGAAAAGFSVVANEIRKLISRTESIMKSLTDNVSDMMIDFEQTHTNLSAEKLSSAAFSAIDIIDRNLYERSCDVRWWATESALVDALTIGSDVSKEIACRRLGLILDSYTVYYDLVLCNRDGEIVANGRPNINKSIGKNVIGSSWFQKAKDSLNGDCYGFEDVHKSDLVNEQIASIYSCRVNENGDPNGTFIGVLGIVFNWPNLGDVAIQRQADLLSAELGKHIEGYVVDKKGKILSSTKHNMNFKNISEVASVDVLEEKQGSIKCNGGLVGYSYSMGYETYKSNMHAVLTECL